MGTTPKLVRKTVVAVKTETTQGSAATIAATDFILAEGDVQLKPVVEMLARDHYRASLDPIAAVAGKRMYECTIKTELKGSGTAGTAYAPLGALLQASGFTETVNAGTNVIYAPSSTPVANFYGPGKSCTVEIFKDGVKHQLVGCMANAKFTIEVNKYAYVEFSVKGVYAAPSDTSPGTMTYLSQKPAVVVGASLTLAGLSAIASKLEIDCGNEVVERPSLSAATGLLGLMISARKPVGMADPEMESVATHPFIANLIAGTEGATSVQVGATAGNICTLSLPKTQYMDVSYGDRNGILTAELSLQFNQSSGDDWLTLTMT